MWHRLHLSLVYTIQPVVNPFAKPVWQPVVSCKRGIRCLLKTVQNIRLWLFLRCCDYTRCADTTDYSCLNLLNYRPTSPTVLVMSEFVLNLIDWQLFSGSAFWTQAVPVGLRVSISPRPHALAPVRVTKVLYTGIKKSPTEQFQLQHYSFGLLNFHMLHSLSRILIIL